MTSKSSSSMCTGNGRRDKTLLNNAVIDAASDPTALDNQVRLKVCSRTCGTVAQGTGPNNLLLRPPGAIVRGLSEFHPHRFVDFHDGKTIVKQTKEN